MLIEFNITNFRSFRETQTFSANNASELQAQNTFDSGIAGYPLSDFSPRKEEDWQTSYLNGRYGALPYVKKLRRSYGNR
jgi:hypothetical protein